jgi:uncharacterized protein YecE (DUF72 family)
MILIGTSGFSYDHWSDGVFYPPKLARSKWLSYYAEHFSAVELNVTFYRLPKPETYVAWHEHTPSDFQFALKGSRYLTHIKRLKDAKDSLKIFFDQARGLKKKFTVALWQMPPSMHLDLDRLGEFLKHLGRYKKVRHAFEFRHASWWCEETFDLLRKRGMAFCHADYLSDVPQAVPDDMPFHYVRFHGTAAARYDGDYSEKMLAGWAEKVGVWKRKKRDVYLFFNNDAQGFAVKNAEGLINLIARR